MTQTQKQDALKSKDIFKKQSHLNQMTSKLYLELKAYNISQNIETSILQRLQSIIEPAFQLMDNRRKVYETIADNKGSAQIIQYSLDKMVGKGGFATCYRVTRSTDNQTMAMKILPKKQNAKVQYIAKINNEVRIMSSLHHENIVKFEHYFQDSENYYILMEFCSHGSLHDLIKRRTFLTQPEIRYYLLQIVRSLEFLRERSIIHRDIKLANFFLDQGVRIKLGDFGLSTFLTQGKQSVCGTPNYIAPEVISKLPYQYEVDLWSTGVIFYIMLFGSAPFETKTVKATYEKIINCDYRIPKPGQRITKTSKTTFNGCTGLTVPKVSAEAVDLLKKIFRFDPKSRPTLRQMLSHPFLANFNIPKSLPSVYLEFKPNQAFLERYAAYKPQNQLSIAELPKPVKKTKSKIQDNISKAQIPLLHQSEKLEIYSLKPEAMANQDSPKHKKNQINCHERGSKPESANFTVKIVLPVSQQLKNTINRNIQNYQKGNPINEQKEIDSKQILLKVYINGWIDCSKKYGLGYSLTNGAYGCHFNDNTNMIVYPPQSIIYIHKQNGKKVYTKLSLALDPKQSEEINKKYRIIQYMKSKLKSCGVRKIGEYNKCTQEQQKSIFRRKASSQELYIHLKNWIRNQDCIAFRFSTNVLQSSFRDKNQIILLQDKLCHIDFMMNARFYSLSLRDYCNNQIIVQKLKQMGDLLKMIPHVRATTDIKVYQSCNQYWGHILQLCAQ